MPTVPPNRRKRKRPAVTRNHVSARLDEPTIARLDALVPLPTSRGSMPVLSTALRAAILAGLDLLEEQYAGKLPKR